MDSVISISEPGERSREIPFLLTYVLTISRCIVVVYYVDLCGIPYTPNGSPKMTKSKLLVDTKQRDLLVEATN